MRSRSLQVAVSPCWNEHLPDVISAILVASPGPLPRGVPSVRGPFLPKGQRLRHRDKQLGTPNDLCKATSTEGKFRGCSHSLMFRLHNSLGPQVAPTARPQSVLGGRAIYTRPNSESLPAPSTGIATCLIRATGTAGLAPAGWRPCRLLLSPFPYPSSPTVPLQEV